MSNAKAILAGFGLIAAAIAAVGPNQRAESQQPGTLRYAVSGAVVSPTGMMAVFQIDTIESRIRACSIGQGTSTVNCTAWR
jgi:hypothetical protein